jgi:serine/threonine protein kinase
VINLGISERERKQILQELRVLHRALVQGERADATDAAARSAGGGGSADGSDCGGRVPSIISFFGAFYADGAIHIALEYMDCGSLHDVLRRKGPIDERVLACIATQMLRGLEALQELKIVHRDVKPGNVLLNSAGEVKLADLGMCGELANSFSRLRSWVGTAAYMSPERISGTDYSFNSDVWSLGVSLWECATGRYPFGGMAQPAHALAGGAGAAAGLLPEEASTGMTFWELLHNIVEGDPLETPMPGRELLSAFLSRSLQRHPAGRPDARELLQDEWLRVSMASPANLKAWVQDVISDLPAAGVGM